MTINWDNIMAEAATLVKADEWDDWGCQLVQLCDDSIARVSIEHDYDYIDGRNIDLSSVVIMIGEEAEGWLISQHNETSDIYDNYNQNNRFWG